MCSFKPLHVVSSYIHLCSQCASLTLPIAWIPWEFFSFSFCYLCLPCVWVCLSCLLHPSSLCMSPGWFLFHSKNSQIFFSCLILQENTPGFPFISRIFSIIFSICLPLYVLPLILFIQLPLLFFVSFICPYIVTVPITSCGFLGGFLSVNVKAL